MAARCPTCAKPLDGGTIADRLLALLGESERPLASAELARSLGAKRTTIYQTTRRMVDRGAIRRAVIGGLTGWILVPHPPIEQQGGIPPSERAEMDRLGQAMADLVGYVSAAGGITRTAAERYLDELGVGNELGTANIVEVMVTDGLLVEQQEGDGYLQVPRPTHSLPEE